MNLQDYLKIAECIQEDCRENTSSQITFHLNPEYFQELLFQLEETLWFFSPEKQDNFSSDRNFNAGGLIFVEKPSQNMAFSVLVSDVKI